MKIKNKTSPPNHRNHLTNTAITFTIRNEHQQENNHHDLWFYSGSKHKFDLIHTNNLKVFIPHEHPARNLKKCSLLSFVRHFTTPGSCPVNQNGCGSGSTTLLYNFTHIRSQFYSTPLPDEILSFKKSESQVFWQIAIFAVRFEKGGTN